jgi:hypothetical protein
MGCFCPVEDIICGYRIQGFKQIPGFIKTKRQIFVFIIFFDNAIEQMMP